jgi:PAS domain S-box-containing protein
MTSDYKPKILIIDDLEVNLVTLEGNLRKLDVQIFKAQSGQEALIRIQQHDFALVIVDIQMPGMNGYEVAEHIRQGRRNQFTPIIFLTAVYFDQLSVYKGYRTGAVDYITKPFNFEILNSKVKVFLDLDKIKHDLIESRKQFRDVVQDQIDMICRTDDRLTISFANHSMASALATNADAIIGQPIMHWITPDDEKKTRLALEKLSPANPLAEVLHDMVISPTQNLSVSSIIRALFSDDYELTGYQWVIRDITAEIRTREQLLQAKRKAEEATSYKSRFLASMSHETRNPLNSIMGMIDLMMETNLDEEQTENLNIMRYSANKLHKLLNDILDLSRIEANKISIEKKFFNLHEEIKKLIQSHQVQARQNNNRLLLYISPEVPVTIKSDALRLGQIISNLLVNSLKFTKNGEVRLRIEKENASNSIARLRFMITDNGIGIPSESKLNLLDEYEQADATITRTYGGSGLGLSISKRLCTLMGGKLEFDSIPEKETNFWFSLPVEYVNDANKQNSKRIKVLIVEDNLLNQQVVGAILKKQGFDFDVAINGRLAIEKIKKEHYDVILMDIQMPVMDGYDATRQIRQMEKENGAEKKSLIIALTANATSADRKKCLDLGMDDYLVKPFNYTQLQPILKEILA